MARFGKPPVEYLRQCSSTSLRYFELSKLEHAANLRRELTVLLDEMMEETALALLARWMLERRSSRSPGAAQAGEVRGRGSQTARELLAGWLSATRQVESGSVLTSGSAELAGSAKTAAEPKAEARAARESGSPPPAAEQTSLPGEPQAADRRPERKSGRTLRPSPRHSSPGASPVAPKEDD